jgi:hypothetical protein
MNSTTKEEVSCYYDLSNTKYFQVHIFCSHLIKFTCKKKFCFGISCSLVCAVKNETNSIVDNLPNNGNVMKV